MRRQAVGKPGPARQALQSGNLTTAQQAFAAVQQVWKQMSGNDLTPNDMPVLTSTTSVTA